MYVRNAPGRAAAVAHGEEHVSEAAAALPELDRPVARQLHGIEPYHARRHPPAPHTAAGTPPAAVRLKSTLRMFFL